MPEPRHARLILAALVLIGLLTAAGCAFEGQIAFQVAGGAQVAVTQSSQVELTQQRVSGMTTRAGQVVRIDCWITGVFDVKEATGSAVLVQSYVVHLRTPQLRRGTPYQLDCSGPLIVELPADASDVRVTSTSPSGEQVSLAVRAPVTAIATAFGKRLRAEPGTQFALVGSEAVSPGSYTVELAFRLPNAGTFQEKVLYTALIACGRSKYLQPIRPLVTTLARVPALTIQPSGNETSVTVPHLFGGIRSYGEATRTLSCPR